MTMRLRMLMAAGGVVAFAAAGTALWPQAHEAGRLLAAQDDPAELSTLQIDRKLRADPDLIARNIDEALVTGDPELAQSLTELAQAQGVTIPDALKDRVTGALTVHNSTAQMAKRFATGLVTGEAEDVASLSGTVAGDLFVFGDIRDVVVQGKRLAMGEEPDRLILGLAAAGLAVTAATYVTIGGAAPVRAGLTLLKDTRKLGRLGDGLASWAGRSARGVVDTPALQNAVATASLAHPGQAVSAIKAAFKAAFKAEKAGGLMRLAKDVGRIGEKAGTRGAMDALKLADGPKDIARAARLAEKSGGQTRGILKILGVGALWLATGAVNLTLWVFGAVLALVGFLASIKATTERMTQSWLDRGKARRARRIVNAARNAESLAALQAAPVQA